ncbi:hypothetical protein PCANB_003028 [Pneumocystis canis]|nr:hypothetical protein PCANB_003028 [Pneumocystis canis]
MRKPPDTSLRQQRLRAWNPILTPRTVLPIFFFIGFFFMPLGAGLLYFSSQVHEITIDYTYCDELALNDKFSPIPSQFTQITFASNIASKLQWKKYKNEYSIYPDKETVCVIQLEVPVDLNPPVFIYYKLKNFYQNHRRYVKSISRDQMLGLPKTAAELLRADDCNPLIVNEEGRPIYPCGLIANSFFNDTISIPVRIDKKHITPYEMTNKGISWLSDKKIFVKTMYQPSDVVPPPNWALRYPTGYNQTNFPNIHEWEEFHVWMKTAGLPTFEKLALRNDTHMMKADFPVIMYNGSKSIVISTRSILGGKNPFLGIAYVSTGALSMTIGMLFTICHLILPRKLGDRQYLSWNQTPQSTHQKKRTLL